ncbi:MAG TPA: hypothetical protein VFA72_23835 [Burkholderiales bacterium]|nr:hypothetical protein [Burkholderiales bacterium]
MQNWRILGLLTLLGAVSSAMADSARDALDEMARCAAISDAGERLRCYDAAAAQGRDALKPQPADFGKPAPRVPEPAQITASLRQFWKTSRGLAVFVLDNGQTWRQLEADGSTILEPAPGTAPKVTIDHGLLDSYNLTIEGRNGLIKVRRIQ